MPCFFRAAATITLATLRQMIKIGATLDPPEAQTHERAI